MSNEILLEDLLAELSNNGIDISKLKISEDDDEYFNFRTKAKFYCN